MKNLEFIKKIARLGAGEMAQWIRMAAAKPEDLNSIWGSTE